MFTLLFSFRSLENLKNPQLLSQRLSLRGDKDFVRGNRVFF